MCRFLVYKGRDPILLSDLILSPQHSILTQSYDSRLRRDVRRPHNGDGFGIGYYAPPSLGPDPCIFTSTIPAWNCINLSRIAAKTTSSLIFAHVRATTEGSLSDANCHPFSYKNLMWMHNGNIAYWKHVKRSVAVSVGERWFNTVHGSTDSQWAFAVFLDCLEKAGYDPDDENYVTNGFPHAALRKALLCCIERINGFSNKASQARAPNESEERSLLNFAVTDGHSVLCTKYVNSKSDEAASLYFSSGTSWSFTGEPGQFKMERKDKGADIVLVASEPLTFERDNWVTVPTNSVITINKQTVMIHPIIDEFYSHSPSHQRSSGYAVNRGLITQPPANLQASCDQTMDGIESLTNRLETIVT